jgi:hypothetical protein
VSPQELGAAAAAGAISGLTTDMTFLPFDTLRARLNYFPSSRSASANPLTAMRQAGAEMVAAEGVFSLFRGSSAVALFCGPTMGIYFGTYKAVAMNIEARFGGPARTPGWAYLVAGLSAEAVALVLFLPYDVTKQRLQCASASSRQSVFGLSREIVAQHGVAGLYRGALATMATYIPFSGVYFATYEQLKRALLPTQPAGVGAPGPSGAATHAAHFAAAVSAGAASAFATQPIDVIKTRIQVGEFAGGAGGGAERTMVGTLRAALVQGGVRTLMRGALARVLAIAPGCGCSMTIFEMALPRITAIVARLPHD